MTTVIAILAPGAMGSAVGRRLVEHGALVLTSLSGRSAATRGRAQAAGMLEADDDRIAGADLILSILPPAEAAGLAQRLAPALCRGGKRVIYVDCNAVNVATVQRIAGLLAATPARFVDGAIIGAPPRPGTPGPTFYFAGEPAADLGRLQALGLQTRTLDGPIGAASALKMAYAGFAGEDRAVARIYQGIAELYQRLGADQRGEQLEFGLIEAFLGLAAPGDLEA